MLAMLVWLAPAVSGAVPTDPYERVGYHVREAEEIGRHFEDVMRDECPRFASTRDWNRYFDGEVDRLVLMMAHIEQAWIEAKRTHDDDLRRTAKAPRKRYQHARALVGKLAKCANDNGTSFMPFLVWRKIEREVPKRQAEIALPLE